MLCQADDKKLPTLLKRLNAGLARQGSEDAEVALDEVDEAECPNKDTLI